MVELSKNIKELRVLKGLTQKQLADMLGVTSSIISSYEIGIRLPSLETLVQLSNVFGVTTDYLLGKEKKRTINVDGLTDKQQKSLIALVDAINDSN